MEALHHTINVRADISWEPVNQKSSISPGKQYRELLVPPPPCPVWNQNISQSSLSAPSARPCPRWWPQDRQSGWQHRLHLSGCHAWQFLMQIKRSQFISATIHSPSTPFVCLFVWIPNSPLPTLGLEGASKCYIDPHPPPITRHVNLDVQLVEIAWTF